MLADRMYRLAREGVRLRYAVDPQSLPLQLLGKQPTPLTGMDEALSNWLRSRLAMAQVHPLASPGGLRGKEVTPAIADATEAIDMGNAGALPRLIKALQASGGVFTTGHTLNLLDMIERMLTQRAGMDVQGGKMVPQYPALHAPWMNQGAIPQRGNEATLHTMDLLRDPRIGGIMARQNQATLMGLPDSLQQGGYTDLAHHVGKMLQTVSGSGDLHTLLVLHGLLGRLHNQRVHLHHDEGSPMAALKRLIEANVGPRQAAEDEAREQIGAERATQVDYRPGEVLPEDYYAL